MIYFSKDQKDLLARVVDIVKDGLDKGQSGPLRKRDIFILGVVKKALRKLPERPTIWGQVVNWINKT